LILQRFAEGVQCGDHLFARLGECRRIGPFSDQAISPIACLDDHAPIETGPIRLTGAVRFKKIGVATALKTETGSLAPFTRSRI